MNTNRLVSINLEKTLAIADILNSTEVPPELESSPHKFIWKANKQILANCYLAIVAICHQTSPIGEKRLEGKIGNEKKYGWDYLKEKYLMTATGSKELSSFEYWKTITPLQLSKLYLDQEVGLTLNRINERTYLLNDLGGKLQEDGYKYIYDPFKELNHKISGPNGFLNYLGKFEAYKDPLKKKSFFFLSLAKTECNWSVRDPANLLSPIDYHELRGHLRIGTAVISGNNLREKVLVGLPINLDEDNLLRTKIQEVNNILSKETKLSSGRIHYLLWNIFRNCCPRDSEKTHCSQCPQTCKLPTQYKDMDIYNNKCIFSTICESSNKTNKVIDPPYIGHYY